VDRLIVFTIILGFGAAIAAGACWLADRVKGEED
jgi:hypothetical protein